MTRLYQYKDLEVESINFIDIHALDVLQSDDFLSLSSEALHEILKRDSFCANELVIFRMVCRWINENQIDVDPDTKIRVLSAVRYPLMSDEELSEARKSQVGSTVSNVIQFKNTWSPDEPKLRGQLKSDVNLINESQSYPPIRGNDGGTYMLTLDHPSFINYIELLLSDGIATNPKCMNASVIKGTNSVSDCSLLDHYCESSSRFEEYTWHWIGSSSIVVHLVQPYILSSIR
ncbi:BTB/POZ domain-containing protein 9-like [Adelges cooleyi]|uniref:BTB/POZ domain-containing protein 9-like n=1 Tax=Adelges cooleyi TaxID=133065 RepID=UPI00217F80E9|nr:BTB/POZ domain-containing protein 9-like [Adelges cooleyi]